RSHVETESFDRPDRTCRLIDRVDPEMGHLAMNGNSRRIGLEPERATMADDRIVGSRLGDDQGTRVSHRPRPRKIEAALASRLFAGHRNEQHVGLASWQLS